MVRKGKERKRKRRKGNVKKVKVWKEIKRKETTKGKEWINEARRAKMNKETKRRRINCRKGEMN